MDLTAHRSAIGRPVPWRSIGVLVALALVLAAVAAVAVGSRRQAPAPFGLARNGVVAYAAGGDILIFDPATGVATPRVTGPTVDVAPLFSRDGTRILFLREAPGGQEADLVVADADGANPRVVSGPHFQVDWMDWSPDGRQIAVTSTITGRPTITIAHADGSPSRVLDVGMPATFATWRPPDGAEIIFRGEPSNQLGTSAVFAVAADGSGLRELSTTRQQWDFGYQQPQVSPDGRRIAYANWTGSALEVHVLDTETGEDVRIPSPDLARAPSGGNAVFSPDGRLLVYQWFAPDAGGEEAFQFVVAPSDGSSGGSPIGPLRPMSIDRSGSHASAEFSPDGTQIIALYGQEEIVRILPIAGGEGETRPWGTTDVPSMQRLAP